MNTSVRNSGASFWEGMGGFGNGSGTIAQAGTDVFVDGNGNVSYTAWYEVLTSDNEDRISDPIALNASCGTQMYVETDSPFNGLSVYFLIDGGGVDNAFTPNWPASSGDSGECFVEDPHPNGPHIPLANFNYVAFSNCYMNGEGIGNRPNDTYLMYSTSGQIMARPGGFYNAGLNYNVYWKMAN